MADNNEEEAQNDCPVVLGEALNAADGAEVLDNFGGLEDQNPHQVLADEQLVQPPVAIAIDWGDGDEAGDDDGLFFADGAAFAFLPHAPPGGRAAESITSALLLDMVKVPYTCTSILSGWSGEEGRCSARVQQCQETPEQAFYTCARTGRNPLHEACLRNACVHVIRALVSANRNGCIARDNQGNLPLHLLFISHSPMSRTPQEMDAIVEALLESNDEGIAPLQNRDGNSSLHIACSAEPCYISPSVIRRLLGDSGACASVRNILNQMPLHVYCEQPSNRTSTEIARVLLEAHPQAGHAEDVAGRTPLHHAAIKGNTELICFLVEHAERAASIRSGPLQETPLHVLCQQKPREQHLPALRALVNAAPGTVTMANSQMSSPLHVLCQNKQPQLEAIRLLINADLGVASMTDSEGYTALHYACEYQAGADVVECLLAAYREAASVVSRKSDTALHIACSANSSSETVKLLIKANPDALTMKNDYGYSPLHSVCRAYTPRVTIVQAIVEACPNSVTMQTNGGEIAMHLACSSGAYVNVLRLLAKNSQMELLGARNDDERLARNKAMANKIGNTPLHEACFRGAGYEQIETLAQSNPGWVVARNNAGFTPLQILCKGGRLDERVVTSFSRIGGPEVFSVVDDTGHTPLHSACREGNDIAAIQSLIQAYPDAMYLKTVYGDTPLHLAVLRKANVDVVRLIAESRLERQSSPLLERNVSSQTPVDIAMESFQSSCRDGGDCCVQANALSARQVQSFDVLAMFVKLLFYGTANEDTNLVTACVSLHRQNVRLDPAFIRRAITLFPEQVRAIDDEGNYPLHIEASIPVEKMSLLDPSFRGCCGGRCHTRIGVLEMLLEAYPEALTVRNSNNEFPLGLMIRSGRTWDKAFALALSTFPPALHWYGQGGIDDRLLPSILVNVSKYCGTDTLYQLLNTRPTMATQRPDNIAP